MRKFWLYIVLCVACLPVYSQVNTDQVLRIGQNALYFEDYMLSIQYFNLVIQAKPEQAKPYFYRAIAKFNLEDYRGAEEDATFALDRNPFLNDVWEIRGVARQYLGKYEEAIADYDKALEGLPGNKQILFNKAMAQEATKDYAGAELTLSHLLAENPNYDRAYRGRAKLYLSQGDTLKAIADIDTAIILNKNIHENYVMRAHLNFLKNNNFESALIDMDEAIKLHPQEPEYYNLRAQIKYKLDDYDGAIEDYSLAIEYDKDNLLAFYNRAVLRSEIRDLNRAIDDFSKVLSLNPTDYRTLYNRAILYRNINDYRNALADVSKVIQVVPNFPVAYFLRFEIYQKMGNEKKAFQDYDKAVAMVKKLSSSKKTRKIGDPFAKALVENSGDINEIVEGQFLTLLPTEPTNNIEQQYNSKDIRGHVQDKEVTIEPEPMFLLTYYSMPSELKISSNYIKEVDDINASKILQYPIVVTNREQLLIDEEEVKRHFESIKYYDSYISTHPPRSIDYFGRALDFVVTRNYKSAIKDLNKAIELTPDFDLAYFLRATSKYNDIRISELATEPLLDAPDAAKVNAMNRQIALSEVLQDWDKLIELHPRLAIAHYNKANTLLIMQDYVGALGEYNKAIKLDASLGEAYFNRGYVYLKMGNKEAAIADISKAGEYGIISSYNLLKRITQEQLKR